MRTLKFRSCCVAIFVVLGMQSLVEIARQEAERRKRLEQQGIEGKVFEGNPVPSDSNVNVTVWTDPPETPEKTSTREDSSKKKTSPRSFRTAIQKLDRLIKENKDRLKSRRARLQSARWSISTTGRSSGRSKTADSPDKLQRPPDPLNISIC